MGKQNFSVLMCVCDDDDKRNFQIALESITLHQILKPNEVILVFDGSVDPSLTRIAEDVFNKNKGSTQRQGSYIMKLLESK
mgnify:CR=1 FL=1